jgi:DNA-binding NarL/FixJ family response regulator
VTHAQPDPAAEAPPKRTLVFVSGQLLLAGILARLFTDAGQNWAVEVLDIDHDDLLRECRRIGPNVVVVDVDRDVIPGLAVVAHLARENPASAVLVLGEISGPATAQALRRGARGVLTYAASPQDVLDSVEAAAAGHTTVEPVALAGLIGRGTADPAPPASECERLSTRESDILRRLVAGTSTCEIAAELGISVQTVRKHTQNILHKLGAHSKLEAAAMAVRSGFV